MANHELIYRGEKTIQKLASQKFFVFGLGAVGSELVNLLVRMGAKNIAGCDKDRVEADNVTSQLYGLRDRGALKADALKSRIFNDTQIKIDAFKETVSEKNLSKIVKAHPGALFIDCFDNTASRKLLKENLDECLHIGLGGDYCEIVWQNRYRVPSDEGMDVCNYPQAKPLTLTAVSLAAEVIMEFLVSGKKLHRAFTLKDFRASEY